MSDDIFFRPILSADENRPLSADFSRSCDISLRLECLEARNVAVPLHTMRVCCFLLCCLYIFLISWASSGVIKNDSLWSFQLLYRPCDVIMVSVIPLIPLVQLWQSISYFVYICLSVLCLSFLYQLTTVFICVLSEFVVACIVYCMFWLPCGVINDDRVRRLTSVITVGGNTSHRHLATIKCILTQVWGSV